MNFKYYNISSLKKFTFFSLFSLCTILSQSQTTEGNWMVGGSGSFTRDKASFSTGESISTKVEVNPRAGYFITNNFAMGLIGNFGWASSKSNNIQSSNTNYGIGPFFRYYLFTPDNTTNFLIEANGSYNQQKNSLLPNRPSYISFSTLAGPVIFFNSSVGLELLFGYKGIKEESSTTSGIFLMIGLQVHLDK